jgi:hypothetical protein
MKLGKVFNKALNYTLIAELIIFIVCIGNYFFVSSFEYFSFNLLSIYLIEILFLYITAVLISFHFFKKFFLPVIPYIIVKPIINLILTMYSFCNVHNCSWGTKGLDNSSHGLGKTNLNNRKTVFNRFRLTTVLIWVLTNAFMTYFYIASDNFRVSFFHHHFPGSSPFSTGKFDY